jgi:hypothetical protein
MSHVIGYRDEKEVVADYRIDINTESDVREFVELSGAAKSPPPNHEQSDPQQGYQRVVWAETATVKDTLMSYLDTEGIAYTITDLTPTLSEAQSAKIDQIKSDANDVLEGTDWYVVREQETGESIPQSVSDHRSKIRSLSDKFESDVNALDTVSDVQNYDYSYPDPPEA